MEGKHPLLDLEEKPNRGSVDILQIGGTVVDDGHQREGRC